MKTYSNPIKIKSRQKTIIDEYRHHFGPIIPEDEQYWTMCNYVHYNLSLEGKELGQLLESNLIQSHQFHGVEILPEIHEENTKLLDKLSVNLYNGNILEIMQNKYRKGDFNPAIINLDTMWEPHVAANELCLDVIQFITECLPERRILLVLNFVAQSRPWRDTWTGSKTMDKLLEDPYLAEQMMLGIWSHSDKAYEYKAQKTEMITVLMIKENTDE